MKNLFGLLDAVRDHGGYGVASGLVLGTSVLAVNYGVFFMVLNFIFAKLNFMVGSDLSSMSVIPIGMLLQLVLAGASSLWMLKLLIKLCGDKK